MYKKSHKTVPTIMRNAMRGKGAFLSSISPI
jgi:hypothetical protein